MRYNTEVVLNRRKPKARVSVILIDWAVRESFHSLHYLNQQTVSRDQYELIWLEFYDHKPEALRALVDGNAQGPPILDKWMVLGYPSEMIYHKHRMYNIGILLAEGDICVICDSDAIFQPTFLEKILAAFDDTPRAVVHLDEVRNVRQDLYPFCYPSIETIAGSGNINWHGTTTRGLDNSPDMLHHANYGACMAARRKDLLAIGGADEHLEYLGYVCGPYDLTFRLINYGRTERWLRDEYLYHTWHPNQYGFNTDYHGPHDGMHMALLAMESRATYRVTPCLKNPWFPRSSWGKTPSVEKLCQAVSERAEPTWYAGQQPPFEDRVSWMANDHFGFNIFYHEETWYAVRTGGKRLDLEEIRQGSTREIWQGATRKELEGLLPLDREQWRRDSQEASFPIWLWRRLRAQPWQRLPARVARKARRLLT